MNFMAFKTKHLTLEKRSTLLNKAQSLNLILLLILYSLRNNIFLWQSFSLLTEMIELARLEHSTQFLEEHSNKIKIDKYNNKGKQ